MTTKLFDSERKVMQALWDNGDLTASQMTKILFERTGWNRNTTYTVIKKCIEKKFIERGEPAFMCKALITRDEAQKFEISELVSKMFDNSNEKFFAAFLTHQAPTKEEIDSMKKMINDQK